VLLAVSLALCYRPPHGVCGSMVSRTGGYIVLHVSVRNLGIKRTMRGCMALGVEAGAVRFWVLLSPPPFIYGIVGTSSSSMGRKEIRSTHHRRPTCCLAARFRGN
jgi:hypothetical protein